VDLGVFSPAPPAARAGAIAGVKPDESLILFVGRIQQLKGVDVLVRATALLAAQARAGRLAPFRVLIVGGRPTGTDDDPQAREIERLKTLADQTGASDYISWVGPLDHHQLPTYYRAADVTVMPSTYESFGLVAVESMACGTPVVAARVGGLQATVIDGVTGFLVPWRDPTLYADRIKEIISNHHLRERLSRGARDRAAEFGWPAVSEELSALYRDLIEQSNTPDASAALLAGR
jgi:D-inositol-3-phosphate glycosyltransferase